jgi:ribosome-binding protein aMBF1 (putative translation factor)
LYITTLLRVSSTQKSGDNTFLMMNFEEEDNDTPQFNVDAQVRRVAVRLREEREKARISQMDLSLQAGLSQNQVFCIETGKRIPNLLTILKLCGALGISPATLFINDDQERAKDKKLVMDVISKYM